VATDISDIRAHAETAAKAQNPTIVFKGTAIERLLVESFTILAQPIADQIKVIRDNQTLRSVADPDRAIEDAAVDDLIANIFVTRRVGSKAVGAARLFYLSPISETVPINTVFRSSSGLTFFARADTTITQAGMSLNKTGDFFFFDVNVIAQSEGDEFEIGEDELVEIASGFPNVVRVSNPSPFTEGLPREENEALVARAQQAITERSLVTDPGINAVMRDNFPQVLDFRTVGFGDPEMIRDILTGTDLEFEGIDLGDATELHIGGKVDVYLRTGSREATSFTFIANTLNTLRGRDKLDTLPIPATRSFVLDGGFATGVVQNPGDTVVTDANAAFVVSALVGKTFRVLTGRERGRTYTVSANTATTITLPAGVDIRTNDSYVIEGALALPIIRITTVEEIDPVTSISLGNVLVLDVDYQINVDNESLNFSPRSRLTLELIGPNAVLNLGKTFRVDYETVAVVQDVDDFMALPNSRVICADLLAKHALPIFVSGSFDFRLTAELQATITPQDLSDALIAHLNTLAIAEEFQLNDIPVVLAEALGFQVRQLFLRGPLEVTAEASLADGSTVVSVEQDRVTPDRTQVILPGTIEFVVV
jgi:hypothetical protein